MALCCSWPCVVHGPVSFMALMRVPSANHPPPSLPQHLFFAAPLPIFATASSCRITDSSADSIWPCIIDRTTLTNKGPVTAVAALDGHVIAAEGPRVFVFEWRNARDGFNPIAFFDAAIYVVSIATIHSLVLVGDIVQSVCAMLSLVVGMALCK